MAKRADFLELWNKSRILRMASDTSLGDLARACGVSVSLLSLVESGSRAPSLDLLRKISDALHIPFSALLVLQSKTDEVKTDDNRANKIVSIVEEMTKIESRLKKIIQEKAQ